MFKVYSIHDNLRCFKVIIEIPLGEFDCRGEGRDEAPGAQGEEGEEGEEKTKDRAGTET